MAVKAVDRNVRELYLATSLSAEELRHGFEIQPCADVGLLMVAVPEVMEHA